MEQQTQQEQQFNDTYVIIYKEFENKLMETLGTLPYIQKLPSGVDVNEIMSTVRDVVANSEKFDDTKPYNEQLITLEDFNRLLQIIATSPYNVIHTFFYMIYDSEKKHTLFDIVQDKNVSSEKEVATNDTEQKRALRSRKKNSK